MTKVVQIQKSSRSAGSSALKLHKTFLEAGFNSYILTLYPDENDTDRIFYPGKLSKIITIINDKLNQFLTSKSKKEFGLFSFTVLPIDITGNRHLKEADIIFLHWVQGEFLSIAAYRKLARMGKPIVAIMHDMWTFTGGCHYSFSCEKYKSKCFDCQVFSGNRKFDMSSKGFIKKKKLFTSFNNFFFVSPSKWLMDCAKESSLLKSKPVYHVPNILDNRIFKPTSKSLARQVLDIDSDEEVIAFGAVSVNSPYKGWDYLKQALVLLSEENKSDKILLLIFGKSVSSDLSASIPFRKKYLGYLKDEISLALVYNAANVFVTPSLADNLPTTVLESLSCGTPVVGFKTGGIPEMIRHKENGYLANYMDADDLSRGIKYCLHSGIKGELLPEFGMGKVFREYCRIVDDTLKFKI